MATLQDYYNTGDNGNAGLNDPTKWKAQTFTASGTYSAGSVKLKLWVYAAWGAPTTVTASIRAVDGDGKPTGADLASGSVAGSSINTSTPGTFITFTLSSSVSLTSGVQYAIVLRYTGGGTGLMYRYDTSGSYVGGGLVSSDDSGSTWGVVSATNDGMFEVYDDYTFTPPTDIITYKRLIAAANNKIWYESI